MDIDLNKSVIFKQKASKVFKLLWILILCGSVWGLGYYVSENYIKLNINPEILVTARYVNSRTIPFPAITICPPNVIKLKSLNVTKLFDEHDQGHIPEIAGQKIITAASHVCFDYYNLIRASNINIAFDDDDIVGIYEMMSPNIEDTITKCSIGTKVGCNQIFIRVPTCVGSCFTFNMLGYHSIFNPNISADFDGFKRKNITKSWNPKAKIEYYNDDVNDNKPPNWTIRKGYTTDDDWVQPLRASGLQYLWIGTKIKKEEVLNICENNYNSYRIIFHFPNEVPTFSNVFTSLSIGEFKYMRLSATIQKIDAQLNNFPPENRKCLYDYEKPLKYFKSYTKLNCELECMTNFTYKTCGCVAFWMPKSSDMNVCKFKDIKCFKHIFYKWASSYYEDNDNVHNYPDFPCSCYPTCTKIEYSIINEFSMNNSEDSVNATGSGIQIAFGDSQILETTNYVTYKIQNFVSDIGGLAGLFLGFSLLSLFELILKASAAIRNFVRKTSCTKNNKRKQSNKARKPKTQKPQETRRKVTQNNAISDVVVIDLLFGEQVEASSLSELNQHYL